MNEGRIGEESSNAAPHVIERGEQPYAAVRCTVTMDALKTVPDRLGELMAWLSAHDAESTGPVFFRYDVIDMEGDLVVEVGVPVDGEVPPAGDIVTGTLPAGRYASLVHVGHPDQLRDATGRLLAWGDETGVVWDVIDTPSGSRWGCRLELYLTDPAEEPDMNRWVTRLAFRLADDGAGASAVT